MSNPRVLIYYSPRLYAELFSTVLKSLCGIEIIDTNLETLSDGIQKLGRPDIDIIITSLDEHGRPTMDQIPSQTLRSKVLAFSPTGKRGLKRMPNSKHWEEIAPFGLDQLIREVIYASPKTHTHRLLSDR
jgi:hypothetical protein